MIDTLRPQATASTSWTALRTARTPFVGGKRFSAMTGDDQRDRSSSSSRQVFCEVSRQCGQSGAVDQRSDAASSPKIADEHLHHQDRCTPRPINHDPGDHLLPQTGRPATRPALAGGLARVTAWAAASANLPSFVVLTSDKQLGTSCRHSPPTPDLLGRRLSSDFRSSGRETARHWPIPVLYLSRIPNGRVTGRAA